MKRRDFIRGAAFAAAGCLAPGCRLLSGRYAAESEAVRREALRMKDGTLRKVGEVHDEVARYAGRPIGNAGVFSTLPDMTRFVEDLLERRTFPATHYDLLFNGTFKKGKVCRSFGFDMGESRPEGFSPKAIHHSGFTGQFLCVDPELPFAGVVLTLRCPGAEGTLTARRRLLSLYAGGQ